MNATPNTLHPEPGYWLLHYPDYDQRLAAMAAYIQQCNHPSNAATSPVASLQLQPK